MISEGYILLRVFEIRRTVRFLRIVYTTRINCLVVLNLVLGGYLHSRVNCKSRFTGNYIITVVTRSYSFILKGIEKHVNRILYRFNGSTGFIYHWCAIGY